MNGSKGVSMKLTHINYSVIFNIFHRNFIEKTRKAIYSCFALAKSSAEPRNSNNLSLANNSAPCAFFIRDLRTPKETVMQNCISAFLSMVACSGKGFALCCVPVIAVFEPVTRYRHKASKLQAVTSKNLLTGETAMKLFIFVAICRTDLTNQLHKIRIIAETETQARAALAKDFILILASRINVNAVKNDRTFTKGVVYA